MTLKNGLFHGKVELLPHFWRKFHIWTHLFHLPFIRWVPRLMKRKKDLWKKNFFLPPIGLQKWPFSSKTRTFTPFLTKNSHLDSLISLVIDKMGTQTNEAKKRIVKKKLFFASNYPPKLAFLRQKVNFDPKFDENFAFRLTYVICHWQDGYPD